MAILTLNERVARLNVERLANDASDAEGIGEGVDIGDAAAAGTQPAAGAFTTAVVSGPISVTFLPAGRLFFHLVV